MTARLKIILLVCGLVLVALVCPGATYYVNSSTGDDDNPGTSGSPWLTLHLSFPKLSAGDTLLMTGRFIEFAGGGSKYNFTMTGSNGAPIVVDGQNAATLEITCGGDWGNWNFSGSYLTFQNFFVAQTSNTMGGCISFGGSPLTGGAYNKIQNVVVSNLFGCDVGGGDSVYVFVNRGNYSCFSNIVFRDMDNCDIFRMWGHDNLITHCLFTNLDNSDTDIAHADVIQFFGCGDPSYSNVLACSTIIDCNLSGGYLSGGDDTGAGDQVPCASGYNDWTYRNNIFADHGSQQIQVNCPKMNFYNNVFYNWYVAVDLYTGPGTNCNFANNVFINSGIWNSLGGFTMGTTAQSNYWDQNAIDAFQDQSLRVYNLVTNGFTLLTDPGFVNAAAGNFHLTETSVLRGKGVNLYSDNRASATDFDGVARPASGAWDIGPFQYDTNPPPPPSSGYNIPTATVQHLYANQFTVYSVPVPEAIIKVTPSSLTFSTITNTWENKTITVSNAGPSGSTLAGEATATNAAFTLTNTSYSLGYQGAQTVGVNFYPTVARATNNFLTFTGGGGTNLAITATGTEAGSGISFVQSNIFAAAAGPATTNFTITLADATDDGCLLLAIGSWDDTATVIGATFDGTAMVLVTNASTVTKEAARLYRLAIGAKAAATYTAWITNSASMDELSVVATVWNGVNQTTPVANPAATTGTGTDPITLTVTSSTSGVVVDCVSIGETATKDASQELRGAATLSSTQQDCYVSSEASGSSSTVMSWTDSSSMPWAMTACELRP